MSTQQALVLRDVEGTYFVIPPAALEANRVLAEHEEVSGYIAYLPTPGGAPSMPSYSYGYWYSYGPGGYSYGYDYSYTLPGLPAPGPRVTPLGPVVPN